MKIVHTDLKHGEIKIVPENLDDIWHLYNIIEEGDLLRAVTFRTDEQKADQIRSKKSEKKRMKLGIRVEKISFHEFSDRLRITGVIEEGPQDLGSYHTYNIDAAKMEAFSVVKEEWKHHQLDRLEEAVKQRTESLLYFVSLDDEGATIAALRQSGIQKIAEVSSSRSGKLYESVETTHEYFGDIVGVLRHAEIGEAPVVVIGPGFTREHFLSFGKTHASEIFSHVHSHPTGHAGMNGIHEAIKNGVVDQITKENRVSLETQLVERLFEEIRKDGAVVYGQDEVVSALSTGAVEHLLISDVLLRKKEGDKLLAHARNTQSKYTVINSLHEAGKKFEGIGGVAAFLRYKMTA